ncbi:TlpA family protein disulfide reductase [Candidatus Poribacteria bacterium]|nr:TlpA family protein disulfide reductase [Candidatus Poribacteria bacterium]
MGKITKEKSCWKINKKYLFLIISIFILTFSIINAENLKKAPPFFLWGPKEPKLVMLDDLKGNVVLINFWASWLIANQKDFKNRGFTGKEEIVHLNNLYRDYKKQNKKLKLVTICVDKYPTERFRILIELNFKEFECMMLLSDGGLVEKNFGGIPVLPTTFLLDKNGFIRKKYIGAQKMETLKKDIDELYKEK